MDLTTHAHDFITLFQNDLKQIIPLQEEALQAFIQPETLDGPNQYFCERCKKKCDARKVTVAKAGGASHDQRQPRSDLLSFFILTGSEISALSLPADAPAEAF